MEKMMKQAAMVTIPAEEYEDLKAHAQQLQQQVDYLLEQVRLARRRQFGASSEKSEYDQPRPCGSALLLCYSKSE